jgi:hypothetical protein
MDPVFLLDRRQWEAIAVSLDSKGYILVYDFDGAEQIRTIAQSLAERTGKKVISVFPMDGAHEVWSDMGPREFVGAVMNADYVLSNSFHASAFSLIFQKEFYVVNRAEKINTRMRDLLAAVSLEDRLICQPPGDIIPANWNHVQKRLDSLIADSKAYLQKNIT